MPRDVCTLGKDIIHSVTNPLCKLSSAIHIYGGDFVAQSREQWEEESRYANGRMTRRTPKRRFDEDQSIAGNLRRRRVSWRRARAVDPGEPRIGGGRRNWVRGAKPAGYVHIRNDFIPCFADARSFQVDRPVLHIPSCRRRSESTF